MKLRTVGFKEIVPAYGHVWQRILPNQMDSVECELDLKTELLEVTIKKPVHYAGEKLYIPLSNITYYQVDETSNKTSRKKARK